MQMLKFFDWSYRAGAELADELQYVPMPKDVVQLIEFGVGCSDGCPTASRHGRVPLRLSIDDSVAVLMHVN